MHDYKHVISVPWWWKAKIVQKLCLPLVDKQFHAYIT